MATPAELVRDTAAQIPVLVGTLEEHIAEPSSPLGGRGPLPADTPWPGNAQAFAALMVIWEAIPRLEASIRLAVTGHPGLRRGGSAGNFREALQAVVSLSGGLDEDGEATAAAVLERLANVARVVRDIDEAQRWRPVRGRACPYCGCVTTLKVLLDAQGAPSDRVECFAGVRASGERCLDRDGQRPVARIDASTVPPRLEWADGLVETAPDLDS